VRRLTFGHPGLQPPDRLVCGDNVDALAALPDASVDLVYVDPPFGTETARRGSGGLAFDDRPGGLSSYLHWLRPRLIQMRRVLLDHGSLFVHLDWRAVHYVKVELDRLFGPERFVNEIVWCYSVGGKSPRAFGRKHDTILWYARSADYAFFPEAVRIPRKPRSHMKVEADESGRPVQVKRDRKSGRLYRYPVHAGKVPEDYWTDIETLNRGDRERTGWPTQKPEALLERILCAASGPGALVLDPCSGSGTTAIVAQRLGRRFHAIDVSARAVETAEKRLRAAGEALAERGQRVRDVVVISSNA
jgi:DNA modification methylase